MKMSQLEELQQFMSLDANPALKRLACASVAQLTGSAEGLKLVSENKAFLQSLLSSVTTEDVGIAREALLALINVSAAEEGINSLLNITSPDVVTCLIKCIKDETCDNADYACAILANLTRTQHSCQSVFNRLPPSGIGLEELVFILCQLKYNKKGATLHHLASVISNFTQLADGRRCLMDKTKCIFERLLPFTDFRESKERRHAVVAAIHNCCFEKEFHLWLLSEDIDVATRLLLPLAGPDVFTAEENDSLPLDLQFLPDDKERESDRNTRGLILESLLQLCTTRGGREILRARNVYLILREHHKWEKDKRCLLLNEDLVNLLIRTEEEIGADDLSALAIPENLAEKFTGADVAYLTGGEEKEKPV